MIPEEKKADMRRELILRFCAFTMSNLMDLLSDDDPMVVVLTDAREKLFAERTKRSSTWQDWQALNKKGLWR